MAMHNLTIRVSDKQRALLAHRAGNRPVSDYIRHKLDIADSSKQTRSYKPQADAALAAKILAALGSSELAASMRDIAEAARNGALEDSDDLRLSLHAACLTIEQMRDDLVRALGLKVGAEQ